jgi:hypothetical protein
VLIVLGGLSLVITVVGLWLTPMGTFLWGKVMKRDVHLLCNRGQKGKFVTAKANAQGMTEIKKVGSIVISDGSYIRDSRSGLNLYISFAEFASTIPLWYAYVIQDLRSRGYDVNNIDDLRALAGDDGTGLLPEQINYISNYSASLPAEVKEKLNSEMICVRPYKTIKINELLHMFPFNITPSSVESRLQHMIALKQGLFNSLMRGDVLKFALVIIIGGAVAFAIIWITSRSGGSPVQAATTAVQSAGPLAGLTG